MTSTPEQILENLRQRVEDGDTTVTPEELQQAEAAVQFTRLQTVGQEKREAAAAHQAKVDELEAIRDEVENQLPNISEQLRGKLEKADKLISEAVALAASHDVKVTGYGARIKALAEEGVEILDLEWTANGIIAGTRIVGLTDINAHINRVARKRADYPTNPLTIADGFKPADKERVNTNRTVRFLQSKEKSHQTVNGVIETTYHHKAGELRELGPGAAQALVDAGVVEYAD